MSPQARAELGLPPVDRNVDVHVFWACLLAAAVTAAVLWGQHIARSERQVCPQQLDDGRRLLTHAIGERGHTKCTYEPIPRQGKRK